MDEIVNKVARSGIINLDLESLRPNWDLYGLDIAQWLHEGLVLRESEFRTHLQNHNWQQHGDQSVYVYCSADAIVPTWAYMLIASALTGIAQHCIYGSREEMLTQLWRLWISDLDLETYRDQRVILKGCSDEHIGETVYLELAAALTPVVKSLMFGEPCSTVPVFKKK